MNVVVTETAREMVAQSVSEQPIFAVLHHSEPVLNDPTSTQVVLSGTVGQQVSWTRDGVVLRNSTKLLFAGIAPNEKVAYIALCSDPHGRMILFYGPAMDSGASGQDWDTYEVPANRIELVVA